jgi:hypothetical protein
MYDPLGSQGNLCTYVHLMSNAFKSNNLPSSGPRNLVTTHRALENDLRSALVFLVESGKIICAA